MRDLALGLSLTLALSLSGCGGGEPLPDPSAANRLSAESVAELGLVPFDVDRQDLVGPADHGAMYGKTPEIVAVPDGDALDVLLQDHADEESPRAVLLRLEPEGDGYALVTAIEPPMLDHIMGLARDDAGYLYIATAIVESRHRELTPSYPAEGRHRSNVVRVQKLDGEGEVVFDVDLDPAREAADEGSEELINPMVASSARLAVGGGRVALVHGINTPPDGNDVRHQKAITTHLDATSGEVVRTESIWVSHSFDQRVAFDGRGLVEMHLGDAFPRMIVFARVWDEHTGPYPLLHIKGDTGANNTHTRLGGFASIEEDPTYGYLALFATEREAGTEPLDPAMGRVAGHRDLAIVRVERAFEERARDGSDHLDPSLPDRQQVVSREENRENVLRWLTDFGSEPVPTHAERPKLVALGGDRYLVFFERWSLEPSGGYSFDGTYGLRIDAQGVVEAGPSFLVDRHLPRGDDAFRLGSEGGWIRGDRETGLLHLHLVDESLGHREVIIE